MKSRIVLSEMEGSWRRFLQMLLPRHRGPYQVMEKTDSIYVIEDLVSGKRTTTHIHNLRPFNYDPAYTSPLVVAQHNEQEFIVESIITHRGSRNRRSTLEFQVRWAGFGETCDSWEPYKALMHVDKLHDYLRANTMKTLIPKEHYVATENLSQDFPGIFSQHDVGFFPWVFSGCNPTYLRTLHFMSLPTTTPIQPCTYYHALIIYSSYIESG